MPDFINFKDGEHGELRLEVIRQPLYDTYEGLLHSAVSFFQNPAGRGLAQTNLYTAGQLSWPKRFYVDKLVVQFDAVPASKYLKEFSLRFVLGEKMYHTIPLKNMHEVRKGRWEYAIEQPSHDPKRPSGIYIPAIQNFRLILDCGKYAQTKKHEVRAELHGSLCREIQ